VTIPLRHATTGQAEQTPRMAAPIISKLLIDFGFTGLLRRGDRVRPIWSDRGRRGLEQ
jgi:hypothetical protein